MKIIENLGLIKATFVPVSSWLIRFLGGVVLRHPILFRRTIAEWKEKTTMEDSKCPEIPKDLLEKAKAGELKVNNSTEKYLRPVKGCESTAPEIVALAHELGAYKLSDWDYANKVFKWVKDEDTCKWNIGGGSALETLREGRGICPQKANLFIALCRAGGLKVRYRITPSIQLDPRMKSFAEGMASTFGLGPIFSALYTSINSFPMHWLSEVQIDDKWIAADTTFSAEMEVAMNLPISKFGDDPIESWITGSKKFYYMEGPSRILRPIFKYMLSMPGFVKSFNQSSDFFKERGREMMNRKEKEGAYEELSEDLEEMIKGL